jgi:hypothetical protein
MQRKQQVGECWVCIIFFACVCVGASDSTAMSDDPSSSSLCVVCTESFLGGLGMAPLGYVQCVAPQILFFGRFLLFLVVF